MTTSEIPMIGVALFCGLSLGAFFFGGLWWTIRRGVASNSPAVWFLGSLLLRTSAVVAGLYFVAHGDWRRLLSCLLGFLTARTAIMRFGLGNAAEVTPLIVKAAS
jgi:F1F0 ATPase subunit 2